MMAPSLDNRGEIRVSQKDPYQGAGHVLRSTKRDLALASSSTFAGHGFDLVVSYPELGLSFGRPGDCKVKCSKQYGL